MDVCLLLVLCVVT